MNRKRAAIVAVVAFVCGVVSFLNARLTALSEPDGGAAAQEWLSEASAGTIKLEQEFDGRLEGLKMDFAAEQGGLASALEDPCTPNSVVLERVEKVIAAHENLMREVGGHVVELRGELSVENRTYLMGLCADTVRGPMCRMGGRGQGPRDGSGRGYGFGRGGGAGRRSGGGYGLRMGGMNRLARRLSLSEEQIGVLGDKDPDFDADSERLRDVLLGERAKLLSAFEDPSSSNEELLEQTDMMISAYSRIERRIAEHVLVVRPYLTVEQQKWLIGLCRRQFDSQERLG